ncbi:hypothetical protein JCM4814A_94360 [Streptomyces phaeofaciens JCM 4814]|uniref:Transposase IS701-like DDE domain-containing protein n=1 Tax=Streptomyces phaeofaciens TaxID=68254 RepID=A0A918M0Z9_9ACTN|nr:hypothetical protein GCM10010226_90990 [Streptomyces phaeofaciens]
MRETAWAEAGTWYGPYERLRARTAEPGGPQEPQARRVRQPATPDGLQHLLSHSRWDADRLRGDLQTYAAEQLGTPDGGLIIDDTGFVKKGITSAGVHRQYSGTAGRTENDWAAARLPSVWEFDGDEPTRQRWMLARRSIAKPDEIALPGQCAVGRYRRRPGPHRGAAAGRPRRAS